MPWVERTCDVTDDRTLYGCSMGGLFAVHVLVNHHGLFGRYLIVSPGLSFYEGIYDDEARLAANGHDLEARVWLAAGEREDVVSPAMDPTTAAMFRSFQIPAHTRRIGERLASRGYPGLSLTTALVPDQSHFTMPFIAMPGGLRALYAP